MLKIILFIIITLQSSIVIAQKSRPIFNPTPEENCSALDHRNEYLGKVRNQDEVSWCYAYATSDLIAHEYQTEKISAAATATDYNSLPWIRRLKRMLNLWFYFRRPDVFKMEHQTGFIELALKQSFNKGACLSSDMPTDLVKKVYHYDDGSSASIMVRMKEAQIQMVDMLKLIKKGKYTVDNIPYHYEFPHIDKETYFEILRTHKRRTYFKKIVSLSCEKRIPIASSKIMQRLNGRNVFGRLNEILQRDQILAIDYSSDVLRDLDVVRPHKNMHTSLVVGRRWSQTRNQCEYLIRNTYGEDCSVYDSRIDCEKGNVWVPEGSLFKNLLRLTWLE